MNQTATNHRYDTSQRNRNKTNQANQDPPPPMPVSKLPARSQLTLKPNYFSGLILPSHPSQTPDQQLKVAQVSQPCPPTPHTLQSMTCELIQSSRLTFTNIYEVLMSSLQVLLQLHLQVWIEAFCFCKPPFFCKFISFFFLHLLSLWSVWKLFLFYIFQPKQTQ